MSNWTGEEVYEGLVKWLNFLRSKETDAISVYVINNLLNDVRNYGIQGLLPWQKIGEEE